MKGILLLSLIVCGCVGVPQTEYNVLKEDHERLQRQCESLKVEIRDLRTNNDVLAAKLAGREAQLSAVQELRRELEEETRKSETRPEPPAEGGWRINPQTGGIVLETDILFPKGSAKLGKDGKRAVGRLARMLNLEKYRDYLVRVDGHTDSTPVVKTVKENVDNWFLSARRAHAVLAELKACGVAAERLFLCGYGPNRPVVPNDPKKGSARNRRVEVLLVKPIKK